MKLTPAEQKKQLMYRDARVNGQYDDIWQSVGACAFCEPREKYIFFEKNGIFMTVALYAYIDGHFMIIPRRHIRSVKDLTPLEWETVRECMYIAKKLLRKVHNIKGMQYIVRDGGIVAQSTVSDHLHIHCIPFDSPGLNVWNYRALKYTPIENAELYQKESDVMAKLSKRFNKKHADA